MTTSSPVIALSGAVLLAAAATAACRQAVPQAAAEDRIHATYDKKSGHLTRLEYDSNGDGKIDTWGYMDGSRVVRVEVDENGDGQVDRWEYHKDGQGDRKSVV